MRVLHHNRARHGMSFRHRSFQLTFGDVLDFLVNRQHHVFAWIGLLLDAAKPLAARVYGDQHPAGLAAQPVVILAFNATQPFVVHTDVAQDLGG